MLHFSQFEFCMRFRQGRLVLFHGNKQVKLVKYFLKYVSTVEFHVFEQCLRTLFWQFSYDSPALTSFGLIVHQTVSEFRVWKSQSIFLLILTLFLFLDKFLSRLWYATDSKSPGITDLTLKILATPSKRFWWKINLFDTCAETTSLTLSWVCLTFHVFLIRNNWK